MPAVNSNALAHITQACVFIVDHLEACNLKASAQWSDDPTVAAFDVIVSVEGEKLAFWITISPPRFTYTVYSIVLDDPDTEGEMLYCGESFECAVDSIAANIQTIDA